MQEAHLATEATNYQKQKPTVDSFLLPFLYYRRLVLLLLISVVLSSK